MALADLSEFNSIVGQQQAGKIAAEQLKQQKEQAKEQHALEEKRLQLQHEHENAVLAASQAYQRTQQYNTLAQNPAMVRAMGQQTGGGGVAIDPNSATPAPRMLGVSQTPQDQESYTVPSQVPGEAPFNINQLNRTAEAAQVGKEKGLESEPIFKQQQLLEQQKDAAKNYHDTMDYVRTLEKDERDRSSAEAISRAQQAANAALEERRGYYQLAAASLRNRGQLQAQIHPEAVNAAINDLHNGDLTIDALNKDKGFSTVDRQAIESGLAAGGIRPINDKQKESLTAVGDLMPLLDNLRSLIAAYPHSDSRIGAILKYPASKTSEATRLEQEIQGGFGGFAKALSSLNPSRIPLQEAQKILSAAMPDNTISSEANIKKYNDLVDKVMNNTEQTLSALPNHQRKNLIEKRLNGRNLDHILNYSDLMGRSGKDIIPIGRVKVKDKTTGQIGHVSAETLKANPDKYEEVKD